MKWEGEKGEERNHTVVLEYSSMCMSHYTSTLNGRQKSNMKLTKGL